MKSYQKGVENSSMSCHLTHLGQEEDYFLLFSRVHGFTFPTLGIFLFTIASRKALGPT